MLDPTLRKEALYHIKHTPEKAEDVHAMLNTLENVLKDSPGWTNRDNLRNIRVILTNLSIHIGKGLKAMAMTVKRTPIQKAWFDYAGGIDYLNNRTDPLDLTSFRKAMGTCIQFKKGEGEEGSVSGRAEVDASEQGGSVKPPATVVAKAKQRGGTLARDTNDERLNGSEEDSESEDSHADDSDYVEDVDKGGSATAAGVKPINGGTGTKAKKRKADDVAEGETPTAEEVFKRPKPYQEGRYDPPCQRCATEGRAECLYDNYGNACRRCKHPSKLKCSYSQGTRTSGKPAIRKTSRAPTATTKKTAPHKLADDTSAAETSATTAQQGHPGLSTGSHASSTSNQAAQGQGSAGSKGPSNVRTKHASTENHSAENPSTEETPTESSSLSKAAVTRRTNPTRAKSMKSNQQEGEQSSHQHQSSKDAETSKRGEVLANQDPLSPYLIPNPKPRVVAPGDAMELAEDALRTLGELREAQSLINQRLAEAEGNAATAIRELKRHASIPFSVSALYRRTSELLERTSALESGQQQAEDNQEQTVAYIETCVANAKQIRTSFDARIQHLEHLAEAKSSAQPDTGRPETLQAEMDRMMTAIERAETDLGHKLTSVQAEMQAQKEAFDERVKSLEERLHGHAASGAHADMSREDLTRKRNLDQSVEDNKSVSANFGEQLARIEEKLGAMVEATNTNHGIITRRLDTVESDIRHVKSGMDINSLDLNNLRKTVVCELRHWLVSTREHLQGSLGSTTRSQTTDSHHHTNIATSAPPGHIAEQGWNSHNVPNLWSLAGADRGSGTFMAHTNFSGNDQGAPPFALWDERFERAPGGMFDPSYGLGNHDLSTAAPYRNQGDTVTDGYPSLEHLVQNQGQLGANNQGAHLSTNFNSTLQTVTSAEQYPSHETRSPTPILPLPYPDLTRSPTPILPQPDATLNLNPTRSPTPPLPQPDATLSPVRELSDEPQSISAFHPKGGVTSRLQRNLSSLTEESDEAAAPGQSTVANLDARSVRAPILSRASVVQGTSPLSSPPASLPDILSNHPSKA